MPIFATNQQHAFSDLSKSDVTVRSDSLTFANIGHAAMSERSATSCANSNTTAEPDTVDTPSDIQIPFTFDTLSVVERFAATILPQIVAFVHADESKLLPTWTPTNEQVAEWGPTGPSIAQHLETLGIPRTPYYGLGWGDDAESLYTDEDEHGEPDLLLYRLGSFCEDTKKKYGDALLGDRHK